MVGRLFVRSGRCGSGRSVSTIVSAHLPDYHVRHVLTALRQLRATIRLEMIGAGRMDVGSLVAATLRSSMTLELTNNVVLCSFNNTAQVLEQVGLSCVSQGTVKRRQDSAKLIVHSLHVFNAI